MRMRLIFNNEEFNLIKPTQNIFEILECNTKCSYASYS